MIHISSFCSDTPVESCEGTPFFRSLEVVHSVVQLLNHPMVKQLLFIHTCTLNNNGELDLIIHFELVQMRMEISPCLTGFNWIHYLTINEQTCCVTSDLTFANAWIFFCQRTIVRQFWNTCAFPICWSDSFLTCLSDRAREYAKWRDVGASAHLTQCAHSRLFTVDRRYSVGIVAILGDKQEMELFDCLMNILVFLDFST